MTPVAYWAVRLRMHLEVFVWRHGCVWLMIVATAIIAAFMGLRWWPAKAQEIAALTLAIGQLNAQREQQMLLKAEPTPTGDPAVLAALNAVGYAPSELSNVVQKIYTIARTEGLVLAQSDFQSSDFISGGMRQVQLHLPAIGSYPQVRRFVERTLGELHGVSFDHVGLKREAVMQGQVDMQLKLSIWISLSNNPPKDTALAPTANPLTAKGIRVSSANLAAGAKP